MANEPSNKSSRRKERIGKYEILGHIATGGMGIIYKARDSDLDRLVALKVLSPDLSKQPATLERFRREAKAVARLRHENIVTLFDVGESNGVFFIALEYIEGTDLQNYVNRKCQIDPEDAREMIIQAARALRHAHENGIVHRDIKPSNLLLTRQGDKFIVKLTDFGLAIRDGNDSEFRITMDKTTVGTVDYMSPEQAQDSRAADTRSDIYSLGCTYFHLLTGAAPYAKGTLPERLVHHMKTPIPDVRKLSKNVPAYVSAILVRMLAKSPEDRFQSPTELLHALENPGQGVAKPKQKSPAAGKRESPNENGPTPSPDVATKKKQDRQSPSSGSSKTRGPFTRKPIAPTKNDIHRPSSQDDPWSKASDPADDADTDADSGYGLSDEHDVPKRPSVNRDDDSSHPSDVAEYPSTFAEPDDEDVGEEMASELGVNTDLLRQSFNVPSWVYLTAAAVGTLAVVMVIALLFGNREPPPQVKGPPPPPPKEWPKTVEDRTPTEELPKEKEPKEEKKKPVVTVDTSPEKMNAGPTPWPILDPANVKLDRSVLLKEYRGVFAGFPQAPEGAPVLRVSRLAPPGATSFRTLDQAIAKTTDAAVAVIEIHDDGPMVVPALAPVAKRTLLLRAGKGHRPILLWDNVTPAGEENPPSAFLSLSKGKLILENLDIIADRTSPLPATLFDVPGTDFFASNCTFTIASKAGAEISVVRRLEKVAPQSPKSLTWFQRCYARGAGMTLLQTYGDSASVLVEDSLCVGYQHPLLQFRGRAEELISLRMIRSSLVTGQTMLQVQPHDAKTKTGGPRIEAFVLDSLLARDDATAPIGDMVKFAPGADSGQMSWRSTNCVFAGWKQLLSSSTSIGGNDLAAWQKHWNNQGADRAMLDTWPANPPSELEERPASTFLPTPASVGFAALTDLSSIGCTIGRLPPAPTGWKDLVHKPGTIALIPSTDLSPPEIKKNDADGLYHGESLDLNKIDDLAIYLADAWKKMPPAPRVVLHLHGKGCAISNLRVTGVQHLVMYFVPTKDPKDATILEGKPTSITGAPVIEMNGGHLELIGARIRLSNNTIIPSMIHMQNGNVTLSRCVLHGPLNAANDAFKTLVRVEKPHGAPATLLVRDSVLVSGKGLVQLRNQVQFKARNNLLAALGDGVQFDLDAPTRTMAHVIDHNTIAVRKHAFALWTGPNFQADGMAIANARGNAFLYPFADESAQQAFLGNGQTAVEKRAWSWLGTQNVFDARLAVLFSGDPPGPIKNALRDWRRVWGPTAEAEPQFLELDANLKTLEIEGTPPAQLNQQLERLALPRTFRVEPGQPAPGADLVSLGILKKKG